MKQLPLNQVVCFDNGVMIGTNLDSERAKDLGLDRVAREVLAMARQLTKS